MSLAVLVPLQVVVDALCCLLHSPTSDEALCPCHSVKKQHTSVLVRMKVVIFRVLLKISSG